MKKKKELFRVIALTFILFESIVNSQAQCIQPQEVGSWWNVDSNTGSITRAVIDFYCQDQILNGVPCCPTGPPYPVHLFGACVPTACDWGTVRGKRNSAGQIYLVYDQGFAKRYVYIKMSQYRPGQLWIHITNDFTDPARADYETDNWFHR